MTRHFRSIATAAAVLALTLAVAAQERDRAAIPDQYKWNLADLYPSDAAWRAAKEAFAAELPSMAKFKGRLMLSPSTLAEGLDTLYAKDKEFSRLASYASLL